MSFVIHDNLSSGKNHLSRLKSLFGQSDTVIIASPFLMTDFSFFFGEVDFSNLKHLHLITTLIPRSSDQIKKVNALISLIDLPKFKGGEVSCQISLNNQLHGKVYIFKKHNEYLAAIVTSANFTRSGLFRNHEWGIEFSDVVEITKLEKNIKQSIEVEAVDTVDIREMQKRANEFLTNNSYNKDDSISLELLSVIQREELLTDPDESVSYWLKPIGHRDDHVPPDRLFDKLQDRLNFSARRPNSVKPNDILIACGVGSTKILSLYRVISDPQLSTAAEIKKHPWLERWPWYVEAENLTPNFGSKWAQYEFTKENLRHEFLELHPDFDITDAGSQSFGALQFGHDKLKLATDFAQFIIEKIIEADRN